MYQDLVHHSYTSIWYTIYAPPCATLYMFNHLEHCVCTTIWYTIYAPPYMVCCIYAPPYGTLYMHHNMVHYICTTIWYTICTIIWYTIYIYVSLQLRVQNWRREWNFPLNFHTMRKLSQCYSGIFQNYWLLNHLDVHLVWTTSETSQN